MYPYFNGAYMPFGGLMMIIFWGAVIIGLVALVRWLIQETRSGNNSGASTALETLKIRYAKGEINKEEFDIKKKDLE